MSYVEDMLQNGEQVTCKASTSFTAYISAILIFACSMYPAGLTALASTELALTNRRIIGKVGMFRRQTLVLPHANISVVSVSQGILGRLFGYGSVTVMGKDGSKVKFKGIVWPQVFQQEADEAIEIAVLGRKLSDYVGSD